MQTAAPSPSKSRVPSVRGIRWSGLLLCLAALPVGAVGLGDMVLTSSPGQPLAAEIPVEPVTAQELWALHVGVASERTFLRNGLDRSPELEELRFEIVRNSDGRSVVRMTSQNPLTSSMTVLVEATWLRRPGWPTGRLIRRYAFGPQDLPATRLQARPLGAGSLGTYGPVQAGETLWSVASRFSAPGVHLSQVLVAIFEANPRGFGGNMNGIYQGATLRIPEAVQARRLTIEEATAEAIRQLDVWLADPDRLGQPGISAAPGESSEVAAADELQAELDDTRQLLETRDDELLALRAELVEALAAAQAAEEDAAAARAAVPPAPVRGPGLRGIWIELNRVASRAFAVVVAASVAALLLVGILIGFLFGRRRPPAGDRPEAAPPSVDEDSGDGSVPSAATDGAGASQVTMEIESQLDLARAYGDMGDTRAAKRTLQAVIEAGNPAQRQQAESLLRDLSPPSKAGKSRDADDAD